jgi:hypothetical protein
MIPSLILIGLVLGIGAAIELLRRVQNRPDSLEQHYKRVGGA